MGYKALITIDLSSVDSKTREEFYEILKEKNWSKIDNLTTAWRASFNDEATRSGSISTLENDLKKAKEKSKANRVDYAIQLEKESITIDNI